MTYAEKSSEVIKQLVKEKEISITYLSEVIDVPQTTLNAGLKSKKGLPIDTLIKIADYFNMTVPALCGKEENITDKKCVKLQDNRLNFITQKYSEMNEEGKAKLYAYTEDLIGNPKYTNNSISSVS